MELLLTGEEHTKSPINLEVSVCGYIHKILPEAILPQVEEAPKHICNEPQEQLLGVYRLWSSIQGKRMDSNPMTDMVVL